MSVNISKKGPVYDPGICRCCGASKKCRLLNVEYEHAENKEIYADMFVECFGLVLSHLEGEPTDRLICAMCVARLREAHSFRKQVLQCEEKLLQSRIHVHEEGMVYGPPPMEIKTEVIIKEEVEEEEMQCEEYVNDNGEVLNDTPPEVSEPSKDVTAQDTETVLPKDKSDQDDFLKSKKQLLFRIQRMKERLRRMQKTKEKPQRTLKPQKPAKPQRKADSPPPTDKFIDEDSLAFHNNMTLVENSYACPFQTSYSSYYCAYCRTTFNDPAKLRDHIWKHDPKLFKNLRNLKKATYLDIQRIDCRLCDVKINDMSVFKKHVVEVHGKVLNDVKEEFLQFRLDNSAILCVVCDKSFVFFHAVKRHMAEHFGSFVCDICGAHYFDRKTLDIHHKNSHSDEEKYECHECGRLFKNKHVMYMHVSCVHKKEAAFQCCKCDAKLFSYKERHKHMADAHNDARVHACGACNKMYSSRKHLREHERAVHLRLRAEPARFRSYQCDMCGNSYPRLHYLKLHIQSHSQQ